MRNETVRGLFFILQHHPGRLNTRTEQEGAFRQHLAQHTYFYKGRDKVHNVRSFRKLARDVG